MTTSLARRVERLETGQGGACPVCRGGRVHLQRPGELPPAPCAVCGAAPLVIVVRRVPGRTA